VSSNTALAIKSPLGVMKYVGGKWHTPAGAEGICGANTCTFSTGEKVSMSGGTVNVELPSTYCGDVQGLCGNYNPDIAFRRRCARLGSGSWTALSTSG
jgi:hypothetical protein